MNIRTLNFKSSPLHGSFSYDGHNLKPERMKMRCNFQNNLLVNCNFLNLPPICPICHQWVFWFTIGSSHQVHPQHLSIAQNGTGHALKRELSWGTIEKLDCLHQKSSLQEERSTSTWWIPLAFFIRIALLTIFDRTVVLHPLHHVPQTLICSTYPTSYVCRTIHFVLNRVQSFDKILHHLLQIYAPQCSPQWRCAPTLSSCSFWSLYFESCIEILLANNSRCVW